MSRAWGRGNEIGVVSHSINLDGRLTSISLEDDFWRSLKDIAASQQLSIRDLVSKIDSERKQGSLQLPFGSLC